MTESLSSEQIAEKLANLPEPAWVREMKAYYLKTGKFRPEDLRRLLGDPNRAVQVGARDSMAKCYLK
jgi:hypothetical protein